MIPSHISKIGRLAGAAVALTLIATAALAQATPDKRYALRPIQCISYDPKPSDFPAEAYFDSDFFNGDFTALWGDDGQPGARNDLATFKAGGINLLHLYNWNAQRQSHTVFLDAAAQQGMKVMVPVSNYLWQTITNTDLCPTCPKGFAAAMTLLEQTFVQVYDVNGSRKPHPAAAMWGIYNEYDYNHYDPQLVSFVAQGIITLENKYGIAAEDRLPITSPVSDGTYPASVRAQQPRELRAALDLAARQWLSYNPGKTDNDLPGGLLPTMAIANALAQGQTMVDYKSPYDETRVTVAAIPADFWKTRWIASTNPFRNGISLKSLVTDPGQFISGFPATNDFNTLPPLFFGEMGWSQVNTGQPLESPAALAEQARVVLDQIVTTHALTDPTKTKDGYFLGSCYFQHTLVDPSRFEAFDFVPGDYTTRTSPASAPFPASNKPIRVDAVKALPAWTSVTQGFASALSDEEFADWVNGAAQ